MEIITVDTRSFKEKARDFGHAVWSKTKAVGKAIVDNPELSIGAAVAIASVMGTLISKVNKAHEMHETELRRTSSFYDRSLNCYWQTKRPLNTNEMLEVEARKAAGENIGQILMSMNLLKKVR